MSSRQASSRPAGLRPLRAATVAMVCGVLLSGCLFSETYRRGYVLPEGALQQVPMGATQEQVLIVLGTPSTVATVSGEVFYYISQRTERPVAFMPQEIKDQRVVAVYFDKDRRVQRIADYGIKDGKVFDYISQTTPTGGAEMSILGPLFSLFKPNP
jgi:outer membrane protein assembly factor BamE (lipoprotein component of BamABCDE complex)